MTAVFRTALFSACMLAMIAGGPAIGGEKKKGGGRAFVQLPPLAATVVRPDGRRGILTVDTGVDARTDAVHTRLQASLPRLRAAYVTVIQNHAQGLPPGGAPHADRLATALQRETDRVVGAPGAKVLLGTILIN